jgi:hypothetical protein
MIPTAWNTYEIRWFFKEPYTGLRQFFDHLSPKQASMEERTDDYLLTGREDIGVKLREGRLEIKTRSRVLGKRRIGAVGGMLEEWTKRGFIPAEGAVSPGASGWIAVRKKRWATLYCPYGTGTEYQLLSDIAPKGIQVEYTELDIGPDLWYTAGLEWPTEVDIPTADLPFTQVLGSGNVDLTLSMGYPEFLTRISEQANPF